MKTPSALRKAAVPGLAAVLALSAGFLAAGPAAATDPCTVMCETGKAQEPEGKKPPKHAAPATPEPEPEPAASKTADPEPAPTLPPATLAQEAPAPAPMLPAPPAPDPAEETEAALTPEPTLTPEESPVPALTAPTPSAQTSAGSNWNTPIKTVPRTGSEAALVSFDGPAEAWGKLVAIMAGVFLVGIAGLAFAWWARNRHPHL